MNSIKAINDLTRADASLMDKIKTRVCDIIQSGWYVLGKEVQEFEEKFASYNGSKYCVSLANGTEALELGLKSLGLNKGKKILTVANGGMYSTLAIEAVGSIPIYVDIDPETLTMSKESFLATINQTKVDGIILTHLYGQLADVSILEIAKEKGILSIEDCAQAHGATFKGKKAGSMGDVGCFSFYPTKNLGAFGDGGAAITNNESVFNELKKLRQNGWSKKYHVVKPGCRNSRLDEVQAGVLNLKLPLLDSWNDRRRSIVVKTKAKCSGLKSIVFPSITDSSYVGHLFIIRSPKREELKAFLANKNIPSDVHYPLPDYKQEIYKNTANEKVHLPNTEKACSEILTLPCFPELTDAEAEYMADCLIEFEKCTL